MAKTRFRPPPSPEVLDLLLKLDAQGKPFDLTMANGEAPPPGTAMPERVPQAEAARDVPPVPVDGPAQPPVSAPPGSLIDHRALALSIDPLQELENIRARPPEDYTGMASRTFTEGGERPNFMGLEDEFGFKSEKNIQRARELYAQTPTERESRWEDEFLQGRQRVTDKDIHKNFVLQALMHGQDAGLKFREMQRGEQQSYDKGLTEARDRDAANQRVSPALAEAIAGTGRVTPEAAVNLRMNDDVVKAFKSGMYSQGLRAEGQNLGYIKNLHDNMVRLSEGGANRKANAENTVLRGTLGIRAALANKGIVSSDTSVADSTKLEFAVSRLMERFPTLTPEQAVDALQGDVSKLSPDLQREVQIAVPGVKRIANDTSAARQVAVSQDKVEGEADEKRTNKVEDSIALARNDGKYRTKWKSDWESAANPLREAMQAWKQMTPEGQKNFVRWAPDGIPGAIGKFLTNPNDQKLAGSVRGLLNAHVKANAGSAVTGSEWDRIASEIGIPTGSWSPFQSTAQIEDFFRRSGRLLTIHRKTFETEIGPWDRE